MLVISDVSNFSPETDNIVVNNLPRYALASSNNQTSAQLTCKLIFSFKYMVCVDAAGSQSKQLGA